MIGPGNSAASGSWAVSAPITVSAAGAVTLSFSFIHQLTLLNAGPPAPGTVEADYSYTFTIGIAGGPLVFTSSPLAVNNSISLTAPGSISLPGSGTLVITSGTLAPGSYTATISGSEHTFINVVPEPGTLALTAFGGGLLAGVGLHRRLRVAA